MVHHHLYIYISIQSCLLKVFFQPSNTQIYEFYELSFCRQEQEEETIYKEIHGILDKTHGTNIHGRSMACKNGGTAKLCSFKDEGQHTSHSCREFLVLNRYMKMWISYVQVGITVVVSLSCSPHVLLWLTDISPKNGTFGWHVISFGGGASHVIMTTTLCFNKRP